MNEKKIGKWFIIIVAVLIVFVCVYGAIMKSNNINFKKNAPTQVDSLITPQNNPDTPVEVDIKK